MRQNMIAPSIYYSITKDQVTAISKYSPWQDIAVLLKKRGVNQIFDFDDVAVIPNVTPRISTNPDKMDSLFPELGAGIGTDSHGPFQVRALENIDGDIPECNHFTGGNHGYDNSGSLEVSATGRTSHYAFYGDGCPLSDGAGWCNVLTLKWTNLVQGYNTIRQSGGGREILQENHTLTFDGREWSSYVELLPLERVLLQRWYGFQCRLSKKYYSKVRFPGGANRGLLEQGADCGNRDCNRIEILGEEHKLIMELDPLLDLGRRELYVGDIGAFSAPYGKAYFNIINPQSDETLRTWEAGELYVLRGKYIFESIERNFL